MPMDFTAPFRSVLPVSGWAAKVYLVVTVVLQLDLGWCLVIEWPHFTQRLLTLKEINFSVFGLVGCLAVEEAHRLLDYADAHAQRCRSLQLTDKEIAVLAERDATVTRLGRTVEMLFTSFQVFFGFTPLAALLLRLFLNPHTPSKLPSVLHIHYPQIYPLDTLTARIIINIISFFWYFMLVNFWKLNAKSLFVTFQCLVTDMELLCCAFKTMSDRNRRIDENELKVFFNSAVADHQRICENMKMLDKVSKKIVIGFMNIYGLQLCVYLVFVTMLDDWGTRLRYLFLYMVMLFIMYSIAVNGQKVKDMGETLRLAMCQCEWPDKPAWFRKGILLMMTRSTREMIVRPYDLYTLDMNCITQIVRATYTYLNLAKKFN